MNSSLVWIGDRSPSVPLFVTIPHSGETVPPEAPWLRPIAPNVLLTDVDRFVDRLYEPALTSLKIPGLKTTIHRYASDLNRYPSDVDCESVRDAESAAGSYTKGYLWVRTTQEQVLMFEPTSDDQYKKLVRLYHDPFHAQIAEQVTQFQAAFPGRAVFHIDAHSMPSKATAAHRDAGQNRPDVVVSDQNGKSCAPGFKDVITKAFEAEGMRVAYNWPYVGGRITEKYGHPDKNHHTVQIELNRKLYMDETSRQWLLQPAMQLQAAIRSVLKKAAAYVQEQR